MHSALQHDSKNMFLKRNKYIPPVVAIAVAIVFWHGADARANADVLAKLSIRPHQATVVAAMVKQPSSKQGYITLPAPGSVVPKTKPTAVTAKPKRPNRLVVSSMGVDSQILEGDANTLNKGIWHVPGTSSPDKGGNTVISAHRYKWLPPSTKTFWNLDKVKVGDLITVTWNDKDYMYQVKKTEIVKPNRVDILNNTKDPKLTLFSCTPKFTSKNRLIVYAYPVEPVSVAMVSLTK